MKTTLFALATIALGSAAVALPLPPRTIVNPQEQMVVVPGLEPLGESRISTVEHCVTQTGVTDWQNLITDSDFDSMESCLIEHI